MFGHATYGSEWIPFEWGWDLLTYLIFSVSGIEGIQIFRSLIFSLIFLIIYLTLKKLKVNSILSISMLILLLISIIDRLTPRPHIITYLFLSILLYILVCNRYSDREKNMKLLYFLPIIFLLWCNFHMGVLVGGLLLFLFTLSETLTFKNKKLYKGTSDINYRYIRRLWIVSAICFFTLFLNPHGYYTYIYTYNHSNLKLLSTITEWKSPFSSGFEFTLTITLYKILLLAGIVVLIHSFIKKDIFTGILFIALALHSFRAVRFMTDYEIIMIVFITSSLNYFLLKKQHLINLFTGKTAKALTTVILLIFIILLSTGKFYEILGYYRPMGFGIDKNFFPYDMIEFIKANNIRGKPYHHMAIGGYLIWNIPDEKNYIDSRNLNDEIYNEYLTVFYMKSGFEVIMNKREIDYVLY
ncbi:MAG: hypothetical protein N2510_04375, partial [Ignavibacteria bacterium]|nr:hypothetical protein [Ignavibacteria bacterium]